MEREQGLEPGAPALTSSMTLDKPSLFSRNLGPSLVKIGTQHLFHRTV